MKRLFAIISVSFLLVFQGHGLKAETVSAYEAGKIAQAFISANKNTKASASDVKLVWNGSDKTMKDAPFYVFNSENCFVIVSGNDNANPILGYSNSGVFDETDIPAGLKALLDAHGRSIGSLGGINAVKSGSSSLTKASLGSVAVVDLKTALWGQGSPFNDNCPAIGGEKCVTGCVATSVAILMKYYGYPNQASGPIPGYTTGAAAIVIPQKTIDYQYQWSKMTDSYGSSSTSEQNAAVATLMADVGQMVKMDYGKKASSASSSSIIPGMLTHMKYSNKAALLFRSNYTSEKWSATLKNELDARHPVLYSGQSAVEGGHAYLVDGYDSDGRFHFNWGWSGGGNGFFFFPDTQFSSEESAIVGLVPDYSWTAPTSSSRITYYVGGDNFFGLWADTPYFENGVTTKVNVSILNNSTSTYQGSIKVCVRHSDNSLLTLLAGNLPSLDPYYYASFSVDVTVPSISQGDEIVVYYKDGTDWALLDGGGITLPLRYNIEDVLSVKYSPDGTNKILEIRGMKGMTVTGPSSTSTFTSPVLKLQNPTSGNYTFSNGHAQYTVNLKF